MRQVVAARSRPLSYCRMEIVVALIRTQSGGSGALFSVLEVAFSGTAKLIRLQGE